MLTNSEIRRKARQALGNNIFKSEWIMALLVVLIVSAVSGIVSFVPALPIIVSGLLMVASAGYFVGRVRGTVEKDDFGALIDSAKKDIPGNIVTGVFHSLFIALWTFLFFIPGLIKSYSYAMTFFIKNDHPEYTGTQAITESRRMMNGYKWQLFCLDFSLIGWMILGSLCCGVGMFWVVVYQQTAHAAFYEALKEKETASAGATAPAAEETPAIEAAPTAEEASEQ